VNMFISIGINKATGKVAILAMDKCRETGDKNARERNGEEGFYCTEIKTFEIKHGWDRGVRRWLRFDCDLSLNDVQQVCVGISEAVIDVLDGAMEKRA
jgi:hypothetical protein